MRFPKRSLALLILLACPPLFAQSTIHALFLSDIHLDPYADPAKVATLNAAPAAEWAAILAAPPSPTQTADSAALRSACPVRGVDTPNALWQSSLRAIHVNTSAPNPPVRFVTFSGDLLAHSFDCKYKTLLPAATHADYLAFVEKTIRYIVTTLHATLPNTPLYIALGNNDSGCIDYELNPTHDQFLALTAKIVSQVVPPADRTTVLTQFSVNGSYNVPLPGVPHTRIIVLDDLYSSTKYETCAARPDPAPAAALIAWLKTQLDSARRQHQRVWVMGHIPPGVDLYSTARKLTNICAGAKPTMFLTSESLADVLARNADIIRLALFGHTHFDEMRLLTLDSPATNPGAPPLASETGDASHTGTLGVPLKITASISPVNGNRPSFTLAKINAATATLVDYTVVEASNLTGIDTTWAPEYTYSTAYHQPAFDAQSVAALITGFQADPSARSPVSQAYLRNYFPGDLASIIQVAWPQYACSMNHDSAAAFAACVCAAPPKQP